MQTALIILICALAGAYLLRRAIRISRGQGGCSCGGGDCAGRDEGENTGLVQLSEDPRRMERDPRSPKEPKGTEP